MRKNIFLIPALIIVNISFCIFSVVGQTTRDAIISRHYLKFSLPIIHNQVKDNLVAPLRWNGTGSGLGIAYLAAGPKIIHEVCFMVNFSGLKNRYKYNGYALEAFMGYSLNLRISEEVLGGDLYLGSHIKWNGNINFFRDWDDSHIYWLSSYEAGPSLKWSYDYKEKRNFSVTVQIPLFALISRPPEYQYTDQPPLIEPSYYFKSMNENLKLVTVNKFYSFRLQADYAYQIKNGNMLGGSWILDYKSCNLPRNTTIVTNILMINYYKLFGIKEKK
jgi:hypothetical protein